MCSPMSAGPPEDPIGRHVALVAARSEDATRRLGEAIAGRCWPGMGDRTVPVALEWVRRWGPGRITPALPACSCQAGRCPVCN
jgi:hypothetical protein